jgi:osmotically-inducible protein OsmY
MRKIALLAAAAAGIAWLLDPEAGGRRRALLRDRVAAFFRRSARSGGRAARGVASEAYGLKQKATRLREQPKDFDDGTLKAKVETELFRAADAPKGTVDVNAQHGVVQLRGEVESPELIDELVARARSVQGVQEVENLLHLPGSPAPMHQ